MVKIFDSCEELPLYNYIRCIVYSDLSHLLEVRDKEAAQLHADDLRVAWIKIQEEYIKLMEGSFDAYAISLYLELEALRVRRQVVDSAVDLAYNYMKGEFFSILRSCGFYFKFDLKNPESCINDLKRVQKRSKKIDFDIKEAEGKLKQAKEKEVKITVQFFDKILNSLSKYMGSHVDERVMTVSRYAACLSSYNEYIELLKTNQHAGTGKA